MHHRTVAAALAALVGAAVVAAGAMTGAAGAQGRPSLAQALAALRVPPAWFDATAVAWNVARPWKEARLEIRRLLGLGDPASLRQAVKLTYIYCQKKDIGDGHEYPMYLYLGGETAWAVQAYEAFIRSLVAANTPGHTGAYLDLAACYRHFGEHAKALASARLALERLAPPPWRVAGEAHVWDVIGDLYADQGDAARAREAYGRAAALYPTSTQPYGRDLLPRRVAKIQAKRDLLDLPGLPAGRLKDGTYAGTSLGYLGDVGVTAVVKGGRLADLTVRHKENIPLGATEIIPRRIVEAQSLNVHAVTGATTTGDAIRVAALEALRKAGL